MRYFFLFLLSLITLHLSAQSKKDAGKNGWEISANFSPDLDKTITSEYPQAEYVPESIPISQRPRISYDTVMIGGENRLFSRGGLYGVRIKPAEAEFWYAANVKVHRRLGRFDFSGGVYFSQGKYNSRPEGPGNHSGVINNSSTSFLYEVADVQSRNIGLEASLHYHLLARYRLHPYVGAGVLLLHNRTGRQVQGRVHSDDLNRLLDSPGTGTSEVSTSVDPELLVTFGLIFELSKQWSVALEANGQRDFARGLLGFQVRRML